ncbi:MAG: DUF983 domain-containing protein [Flavobacteriia bacterium]|nr:DUF983 domain-containing protein [Flavobacteriia bacterium]
MNNPLQKGNKLYSILYWKCPNCQEGDLFIQKSPYVFLKSLDMPKECPNCKQDYEIEPGFYLGSLWTSYPIVAVLVIAITAYFYLYMELGLLPFFILLSTVMFILQPLIMRFGRSMWINIFVKYNSKK